jgi:outer membrane lipoprotein LolB
VKRRAVAGLAAAGLLGGCAGLLPAPADRSDVISGRLAVQVAASRDAPARGFATDFELRGDGERGDLELSGPLGAMLARARWEPGRVQLAAGGEQREFDRLDVLAERVFGEALPLQALPDWLRGRPWPPAPSVPREGGFEQLGWAIDLSRFADGALIARRAPSAHRPAVTVSARIAAHGLGR